MAAMYLGTRTFASSSREITGIAAKSTEVVLLSSSACLWLSSVRLAATWSLYQLHIAVPTLRVSWTVCLVAASPCGGAGAAAASRLTEARASPAIIRKPLRTFIASPYRGVERPVGDQRSICVLQQQYTISVELGGHGGSPGAEA